MRVRQERVERGELGTCSFLSGKGLRLTRGATGWLLVSLSGNTEASWFSKTTIVVDNSVTSI